MLKKIEYAPKQSRGDKESADNGCLRGGLNEKLGFD